MPLQPVQSQTNEPNTASSESPSTTQLSKADGEQAREGAFKSGPGAVTTSDSNSPLPGEDEHRPFDLTTMRQVKLVDISDLTVIKLESGRLEFLSSDMVSGRLAMVEKKEVYRQAPNGDLVDGYQTDKGLLIVSSRGNYLVKKEQETNYRKV